MNRIYQGQVSRAEVPDSNGEAFSKMDWEWEGALWEQLAPFLNGGNSTNR